MIKLNKKQNEILLSTIEKNWNCNNHYSEVNEEVVSYPEEILEEMFGEIIATDLLNLFFIKNGIDIIQ